MFHQFQHPFSMIVSGPSGCGKTTFLSKLLDNISWMIKPSIAKIIWCYSENNSIPKTDFKEIQYAQGIPDFIDNVKNEPLLIILDDLMNNSDNSKISELFIKGSHHRNISVILVTQNIFHKGVHSRDISLNTKYLIVFKNPRDQQQFQYLARQIYPEKSKDLLKIYKEATSTPHNYLLIDLTQEISDTLRFRTNIFSKNYCIIYCKINDNELKVEKFEGEQAYALYTERL